MCYVPSEYEVQAGCDQVRKILKRFQLDQIVLKAWAFSSPIFMMMVCMVLFLSGFKSFDLYFPISAYVAWKAGRGVQFK